MESSRLKRRRLMVSYVPSLPDLPARFEYLNDDMLGLVLKFVGRRSYKSFGGLNKHCREIYLSSGMTKKTFLFGYAPLAAVIDRYEREGRVNLKLHEAVCIGVLFYNRHDVLEWVLQEQNKDLLHDICYAAAGEGRLDLLDEVWDNMNDENRKRNIFKVLDGCAAESGKLDVLEWVENKALSIDKSRCAERAGKKGHLHILKWLQEKQGLKLYGYMYIAAIRGNYVNVLKWLREKEVPWHEFTFFDAAKEGNLDILQWLHDEDCPWPDWLILEEEDVDQVKPEVLDWLRTNGYRNRIEYGYFHFQH